MPAATIDKSDRSDQMWNALKRHILRDRERKKQEREAEVEEERLRKEREAREQQDVMTLGETKEQISQLETKLAHLKEEKHQLFLQLKKVLNEDDNRRKQLTKEASDIGPMQTLPTLVHQQLYMPPQPISRGLPVSQPAFKVTTKRPRSPSPPPSSIPVYHQSYPHKSAGAPNATYQSPQKDDARRHEFRAVLWNKTPYPSQAYYTLPSVPQQELSMYYPQSGALQPREPTRQVFESTARCFETKPLEHYALRQQPSHIIHGGSMQLNAAQPAKAGSISAGYPVRQTQYQPPPTQPSTLYTTQSRPLYQSPGGPIIYPPRDIIFD